MSDERVFSILASIVRHAFAAWCPLCSVALSGQAPTPHSGAPKARGLTAKARTERSSALPQCAWLSNTVREIEYQFLHLIDQRYDVHAPRQAAFRFPDCRLFSPSPCLSSPPISPSASNAFVSDILSALPGERQGATFVFDPGDRTSQGSVPVSIQESQRHNPTGIPICARCLKPMVLKGKRPMPFTDLSEETYRCETCGTETKRIVKDR